MATSIDLAVDTSALTAILLGESDASALLSALNAASRVGLCAPNRTELLALVQVQTVPLDKAPADAAADAYRRYGKGRHAAGLDFGDCFSYASRATSKCRSCSKGMASPRRMSASPSSRPAEPSKTLWPPAPHPNRLMQINTGK
jgi:ribonuclease VapC